jgi:hypothetical protein
MSHARKQAIVSSAVWFAISAFLVLIFLSSGVESFTDSDHRGSRVLVAAIILPGYLLNLIVLKITKGASKKGDQDERDEAIAHKSSEITLTILAVFIFVLSIGLYESFREAEFVPVGWLFIMAYGTFSLVSLTHPVVTLVLDYGGKVDG